MILSPILVLASASPRRKELLASAGIACEVMPSDLPETPVDGEAPRAFACRLARAKAQQVAIRTDKRPVLGADTIVVLDGRVLGKPIDRDEAVSMLTRLSGRAHTVITAFCLVPVDGPEQVKAVQTAVTFRRLSDSDLKHALAGAEWRDKAGAYAIQGRAAAFVQRIEGSYTNVVGLPLCEVVEALGAHR